MTDSVGKIVAVGDLVKYFHRRDDGKEKTDIGPIVNIDNTFVRIKFTKRNGDVDFVLRTKSGITKLSDSEAVLYMFQHGMSE